MYFEQCQYKHIVCKPPPPLTPPQFLEGGCWERGGALISGGCSFWIKIKLKSGICNDKKFINKNSLLCHN